MIEVFPNGTAISEFDMTLQMMSCETEIVLRYQYKKNPIPIKPTRGKDGLYFRSFSRKIDYKVVR